MAFKNVKALSHEFDLTIALLKGREDSLLLGHGW
jgi:hypothetical protein